MPRGIPKIKNVVTTPVSTPVVVPAPVETPATAVVEKTVAVEKKEPVVAIPAIIKKPKLPRFQMFFNGKMYSVVDTLRHVKQKDFLKTMKKEADAYLKQSNEEV